MGQRLSLRRPTDSQVGIGKKKCRRDPFEMSAALRFTRDVLAIESVSRAAYRLAQRKPRLWRSDRDVVEGCGGWSGCAPAGHC